MIKINKKKYQSLNLLKKRLYSKVYGKEKNLNFLRQ